jgi:cytochrome oxidase Cu insertion factor (SCO1/SenC/PrrC family)
MHTAWLLIAATPLLLAQRPGAGTTGSAADNVVRQFEQAAPAVGALFPSIHDAEGKPFQTTSLKGRWTVLVSGCLT